MAPKLSPQTGPWKGVSLGGWLLLEPGPAHPLFEHHPKPGTKEEGRCEWDIMKNMLGTMGKQQAAEVIKKHRDTHISKRDFEQIRAAGLNAVRLPFGYWVVLGPSGRDPYVGPGLEYIDLAVKWAEECGLQIVLDLHGCPGGESGEAPCGRRRRPDGRWKWRDWRFDKSLKVLQVLVRRYRTRRCVTGITVCNEPSGTVPGNKLCEYYDKAIDTIRSAGMPSSRVAVVLPVFQRNEEEFIQMFEDMTGGRHKNYCFDLHCYHCFENQFNGYTLAEHLRHVDTNAAWLKTHPVVVGEWSLAMGGSTWTTCGDMTEAAVYKLFGCKQLEAYKSASHGWFFWNWSERPSTPEWNFQEAYRDGLLKGRPRRLPPWDGAGEDPLEAEFNPAPGNPRVRFGEAVCLRSFYGRYADIEGCKVSCRWPDKGAWQYLRFCAPEDAAMAPGVRGKEIRNGQTVRLQGHNGRFFYVRPDDRVIASHKSEAARAEFIVHFDGAKSLEHRGFVYLQSKATKRLLDADEEEEGLFVRFDDFGQWQRFGVEKVPELESVPKASVSPMRKRRKKS